jgi:hypothetical protein
MQSGNRKNADTDRFHSCQPGSAAGSIKIDNVIHFLWALCERNSNLLSLGHFESHRSLTRKKRSQFADLKNLGQGNPNDIHFLKLLHGYRKWK